MSFKDFVEVPFALSCAVSSVRIKLLPLDKVQCLYNKSVVLVCFAFAAALENTEQGWY